MHVRLISYTQPDINAIDQSEIKDLSELVAYCARVSNPGNQNNSKTANKLLKYMIDNKHWSPFEMVNVCLEITTTRDIGRQLLRHRSFSFQEFSQRYADPTDAQSGLDFSIRECRLTNSRMYVNGTLRSWIHYIEVRSGNGTQKEHMNIALECAKVIAKIFPLLTETQ